MKTPESTKQTRETLEARKFQLEQNMAASHKFLNFFESRLPKEYSGLSRSDFKTDLQSQFAESAYSHRQFIAMLENYHAEVMKALTEYDKRRQSRP